MTPREFCYWLMGPFEIAGLTELSAKQVSCIKNHLDLSLKCVPEGGPFVFWLQGALSGRESLDARETGVVRDKLAGVFIHVIDPSYSDDPDVQAKLQAIHDGEDGPLTPLSKEKLKQLQADIEKAQATATKALNRPTPRNSGGGGGHGRRMMC